MTLLCFLCMRASAVHGDGEGWHSLLHSEYGWKSCAAEVSLFLLMALTGGAMISAAGHMIALLWYHSWAYAIGAVGTTMLAWLLSTRSLRPMSWLSAVLTAMFLMAVLGALFHVPAKQTIVLPAVPPLGKASAAVRAVGYASMNIALAIGVICRKTDSAGSTSVLFGGFMTALLLASHALYLRHPDLASEPFPIVRLLSTFGRRGFVLSAALLYLSVFTSLSAVLFALRSGLQSRLGSGGASALSVAVPLAASCAGFWKIVDGLYAPAGLLCLGLVFGPLIWQIRLDKKV